MAHTRFESIGVYLPVTEVSSAELTGNMARFPPVDLEEVAEVASRRVHDKRTGSYEDSFTLAMSAVADCLSRSRYDAVDLDFVISTSISRIRGSRFHFEPSFSAMIAAEIGARRAVHFDISNSGAGMLTGVLVLDRLIKSGMARSGLVVSGEQIAETAVAEIKEPYDSQVGSLTVGNSGAAVVMDVSTSKANRIDYVELMTCSAYSHLSFGLPSDERASMALYTDDQAMRTDDRLRLWPAFQKDFLAAKGSSFAEERFDYIIHQQAGTRFIDKMNQVGAECFGETMPESIAVADKYGNLSSTSHFVALHDHLHSHSAEGTAKYLLVPAASGVVTGCVSATISSLEA